MSTQEYTELQLDALRELANIGSGTAGTALAGLLGRSVDLSVPRAAAMSLEDAVDVTGSIESEVGAVLVPIVGDMDAVALLVSALVGKRELVARPLPSSLATETPVSGAAVLSDGEIALIVDCDALITDQDRADAPAPSRA